MQIVIVICFLLFMNFTKQAKFDIISERIIKIYAAIWFVALFLASSGTAGAIIPTSYSIIVLILHLFTFLLGFSLIKSKYQNAEVVSASLEIGINKFIDSTIFKLIVIISTIYIATVFSIFFQRLIALQSMAELRTEYFFEDLYGPLYRNLNLFFLIPLDYMLYPLFAYMTIKRRNWLWIVVLLFLLMHAALSGGRLGYVRIFLGLIGVLYCMNVYEFGRKTIISYSLIALVGYFLLIITSGARVGTFELSYQAFKEGQEIANEHIVSYTSGPIVAFDYAVNYHFEDLIGGFKNGILVLTAPENIFYSFVSKIFSISYDRPFMLVTELLQNQPIDIGLNNRWNALYTSCMYYYFDFGYLGVIVIPFIFGILLRKGLLLYWRTMTISSFLLVGFIFEKLVFSIIQYNFINLSEFIYALLLIFLSHRKTSYNSL